MLFLLLAIYANTIPFNSLTPAMKTAIMYPDRDILVIFKELDIPFDTVVSELAMAHLLSRRARVQALSKAVSENLIPPRFLIDYNTRIARSTTLSEEIQDAIINLSISRPDMGLKDVTIEIGRNFATYISAQTVSRFLRDNNLLSELSRVLSQSDLIANGNLAKEFRDEYVERKKIDKNLELMIVNSRKENPNLPIDALITFVNKKAPDLTIGLTQPIVAAICYKHDVNPFASYSVGDSTVAVSKDALIKQVVLTSLNQLPDTILKKLQEKDIFISKTELAKFIKDNNLRDHKTVVTSLEAMLANGDIDQEFFQNFIDQHSSPRSLYYKYFNNSFPFSKDYPLIMALISTVPNKELKEILPVINDTLNMNISLDHLTAFLETKHLKSITPENIVRILKKEFHNKESFYHSWYSKFSTIFAQFMQENRNNSESIYRVHVMTLMESEIPVILDAITKIFMINETDMMNDILDSLVREMESNHNIFIKRAYLEEISLSDLLIFEPKLRLWIKDYIPLSIDTDLNEIKLPSMIKQKIQARSTFLKTSFLGLVSDDTGNFSVQDFYKYRVNSISSNEYDYLVKVLKLDNDNEVVKLLVKMVNNKSFSANSFKRFIDNHSFPSAQYYNILRENNLLRFGSILITNAFLTFTDPEKVLKELQKQGVVISLIELDKFLEENRLKDPEYVVSLLIEKVFHRYGREQLSFDVYKEFIARNANVASIYHPYLERYSVYGNPDLIMKAVVYSHVGIEDIVVKKILAKAGIEVTLEYLNEFKAKNGIIQRATGTLLKKSSMAKIVSVLKEEYYNKDSDFRKNYKDFDTAFVSFMKRDNNYHDYIGLKMSLTASEKNKAMELVLKTLIENDECSVHEISRVIRDHGIITSSRIEEFMLAEAKRLTPVERVSKLLSLTGNPQDDAFIDTVIYLKNLSNNPKDQYFNILNNVYSCKDNIKALY